MAPILYEDIMACCDEFLSSLSRSNRKYALKIHCLIWDILKELEIKNLLRKELRGSTERTDFVKILKSSNEAFKAFHTYSIIFLTHKSKEFVSHNKKFEFSPDTAVNLLFSNTIFVFLINMELFRCSLLMALNMTGGYNKRMTVGNLLGNLVKTVGEKAKELKNEMDVQLRNSLAHGLFWIEAPTLYYYEDISLKKKKEIRYDTLFEKTQKQSIITQILICSIADWFITT